ncbi:hypothetical protein [Paenibacillus sp. LPE1-1-1.1]
MTRKSYCISFIIHPSTGTTFGVGGSSTSLCKRTYVLTATK